METSYKNSNQRSQVIAKVKWQLASHDMNLFWWQSLRFMLFTTLCETEKTMICKQYDRCNHREEPGFPIYINTSSRAVWHVDELVLPHFRTNDYFYLFMTAYLQKEFEAACKID